ncbi:hypothetical protein ZOD2009_02555 [Haladaptatus paucihalophilus DX253]|uniref:Uncharacterized protein n=1 Tax=Haladaptatus paucihalophilus DX253 TaxID=797209 RepID=E7QP72_HALPU|nr:hypothetical protein ZOD2009_02555 [Haladaptatus paucihalophilus DX253]SHK65048.1 hypothetical protein SAMN05444342_1977 [Haladaptatus paucihalophilus DX253]
MQGTEESGVKGTSEKESGVKGTSKREGVRGRLGTADGDRFRS